MRFLRPMPPTDPVGANNQRLTPHAGASPALVGTQSVPSVLRPTPESVEAGFRPHRGNNRALPADRAATAVARRRNFLARRFIRVRTRVPALPRTRITYRGTGIATRLKDY
jgi:hypothetical protein